MNETFPNFFTQIPASIMSSKELNTTDKCVYGVIYTMLNATSKCFMSNEKIGNEIGLSKKTISKIITKLVRAGLLNVRLTYKKGTKEIDKRYITLRNKPVSQNEHNDIPKTEYEPCDKQGISMPQSEHNPCDEQSSPLPQSEQDNRLLNRLYEYDEEDKGLQKVFDNFQKNIGMLNEKNITDLQVWSKDLSIDLINYAVDVAADHNAKNYSYINSILKNWFQQNIKTVDQAKANENKNKRKHTKTNKSYSKRGEVRDDDLF